MTFSLNSGATEWLELGEGTVALIGGSCSDKADFGGESTYIPLWDSPEPDCRWHHVSDEFRQSNFSTSIQSLSVPLIRLGPKRSSEPDTPISANITANVRIFVIDEYTGGLTNNYVQKEESLANYTLDPLVWVDTELTNEWSTRVDIITAASCESLRVELDGGVFTASVSGGHCVASV